jgi:RNA polymerase-binding transcription factor DksA
MYRNPAKIEDARKRLRTELNELYAQLDDCQSAKWSAEWWSAASDSLRHRVALVLMAFYRIETGEYGYCTNCVELTERERLEEDPAVDRCAACAAIVYN